MKYILIEEVKTYTEENQEVWLNFYLENNERFAIPSQQDLDDFLQIDDTKMRLQSCRIAFFYTANSDFFGKAVRLRVSFNEDCTKMMGFIDFNHPERSEYSLKCDIYELLKIYFIFGFALCIDAASWVTTHAYLLQKREENASFENQLASLEAEKKRLLNDEDYEAAAEKRDAIESLKNQYAFSLVDAIGKYKST